MASLINTTIPIANSALQSGPIRTQFNTAASEITQLQADVAALQAGSGGTGVTWPIAGNQSRFNPALNIGNGGTGQTTAGAALDALSGQSGGTTGFLQRTGAGQWSLGTPSGGDGGGVTWPISGTGSLFSPALNIANGGTNATSAGAALDNLTGQSGGTTGYLQRTGAGQWSLGTPSGGDGGGGVSWPIAGNQNLFSPVLTIANGGTGAASGGPALDGLSGASGSGQGYLQRSSGGAWSLGTPVTWPMSGTGNVFSPVLNLANGGTNANSASAAMDNLSGSSGSGQGFLQRSSGGAWSLGTPPTGAVNIQQASSQSDAVTQSTNNPGTIFYWVE